MRPKLIRIKFAMLSLRGLRSRPWQSHLLHFRLLPLRLRSGLKALCARNDRFAGFTPLEIPRGIRIRNKKRRFLTGFTLTEVVVASSLLIIAIVPILKALTSAHVSTTIIEQRTRSLALAQAKLDEIKARSVYNYSDHFQENSALEGLYRCKVTDSGTGSDIRTIEVSVGYNDDGNESLDSKEILVTLTTLLANRWL